LNVLKAMPLEARGAVLGRFLFRLLWCSVTAAVAFAIFPRESFQVWFMIGAIIAVSSLGAIVDSYRLEHPEVSVKLLWVLMAVVIGLACWGYFFIRSSG
jgi:hypothetical protein